MDVRKVRDEAEARQALAAATASGLPRPVWARQNGLCPRSLNGWRIALLRRQQLHNGANLRLVELVQALPLSPPSNYSVQIGDFRLQLDDSFQEHCPTDPGGPPVMLTLPPSVRVFLAIDPVDMRGSFDALAGRVRALGLEPSDGHLYLFLSRRGQLAKCLYFDRSGWVVWQKRLLRGSFQRPPVPDGTTRITLDAASLMALLDGIDLCAPRRRWYRSRVHPP